MGNFLPRDSQVHAQSGIELLNLKVQNAFCYQLKRYLAKTVTADISSLFPNRTQRKNESLS